VLLGGRGLEAAHEARDLAERIGDVGLRKRATELLSQRAATGAPPRALACCSPCQGLAHAADDCTCMISSCHCLDATVTLPPTIVPLACSAGTPWSR
jgi:hypothetical protein